MEVRIVKELREGVLEVWQYLELAGDFSDVWLNVGEKEVKSPKLKAKQRLERSPEPLGICDGTGTFGDDGVENSRLTIP